MSICHYPEPPDVFELWGKAPLGNSYVLCRQLQNMVYKYIDIVGTSATGVNDAIKNAIEEAAKNYKKFTMGRTGPDYGENWGSENSRISNRS